jgi:hypothetical protein
VFGTACRIAFDFCADVLGFATQASGFIDERGLDVRGPYIDRKYQPHDSPRFAQNTIDVLNAKDLQFPGC